jgi:hypothetical protein
MVDIVVQTIDTLEKLFENDSIQIHILIVSILVQLIDNLFLDETSFCLLEDYEYFLAILLLLVIDFDMKYFLHHYQVRKTDKLSLRFDSE